MPPVGESDMGLFSLSPDAYFNLLPQFGREATQATSTRERNFLPFLPWLVQRGHLFSRLRRQTRWRPSASTRQMIATGSRRICASLEKR